MVKIDEVWKGLTADSRQSVCDTLASYSGSFLRAQLVDLVRSAHVKQLTMVTNEKRKRDDDDVAQPPDKKPKLAEATTSLGPSGLDIASLTLSGPLPRFGRPTISSATAVKSPSVALPSPAIPSTTNRPATPASSTAKPAFVFGQSAPIEPENPASPSPDCDEHFTIADRKPSGPQSYTAQGTTHGTRLSAHNANFGQAPAAAPSFTAPPQVNPGSAAVSTVSNPPFTGVDMSSLKIPANSNVSLTMNVFQAPSSLHQNTGSSAPRRLKCIQCKAFYLETQNTAMECRRHTGTRSYFDPVYPHARNRQLVNMSL